MTGERIAAARRRFPVRPALVLACLVLSVLGLSAPGASAASADPSPNRILVVIVDGLRPDYVTPEIMPNVHALGERGVVGERSFAVFPSFTRPNRVSIPTGRYPAGHGVVHNHLYHPDLDTPVHTSRPEQMRELEDVSGTPMVTAKTLGERLDEHGDRLLALGNSSWLMNHLALGKGYWEPGGRFSSEEAKAEVTAAIGDPPPGGRGPARTEWEADSYLYDSLGDDPAEVVLLWMGEPDAAGHAHGVGAPGTLEALGSVDRHIGRILDEHETRGRTGEVNIFITSDILFTPAWNDEVNEFGWHGTTTRRGTATHGSDSPFDMHIALIAAGPDIKEGVRSAVPTGNVDFVPTILHLRGIEVPGDLDGRVLHELLRGGPDPEEIEYANRVHREAVFYEDGFGYEAALETYKVGETVYLRGALTRRFGRSGP